jgi:putative FmdB family regulatory protein
MPTYEYVCDTCQREFEVFQSMKDKALTRCEDKSCKGKVKRKLGLGAGIIFKGSGFYITDYRSDSYKSAAKADQASSSSASTSASTESSATKPAKDKPKKSSTKTKSAAK